MLKFIELTICMVVIICINNDIYYLSGFSFKRIKFNVQTVSKKSEKMKELTGEEIYFAGGCLWGVQEFTRHLPGVVFTEAGRANGTTNSTKTAYDGYAECVRTLFDPAKVTVVQLMDYFFEIIDPHSINKQGDDIGEKYRTGVYSRKQDHLDAAQTYIGSRADAESVVVEVLKLSNYVRSDDEHQDRLIKFPNEHCHIPRSLLFKYKN